MPRPARAPVVERSSDPASQLGALKANVVSNGHPVKPAVVKAASTAKPSVSVKSPKQATAPAKPVAAKSVAVKASKAVVPAAKPKPVEKAPKAKGKKRPRDENDEEAAAAEEEEEPAAKKPRKKKAAEPEPEPEAEAEAEADEQSEKKKQKKRPLTVRQQLSRITAENDVGKTASKHDKPVIPMAAFVRDIKEIMAELGVEGGLSRLSRNAVETMQAGTEAFLADLMSGTHRAAVHAGRTTLKVDDMRHYMSERSTPAPANCTVYRVALQKSLDGDDTPLAERTGLFDTVSGYMPMPGVFKLRGARLHPGAERVSGHYNVNEKRRARIRELLADGLDRNAVYQIVNKETAEEDAARKAKLAEAGVVVAEEEEAAPAEEDNESDASVGEEESSDDEDEEGDEDDEEGEDADEEMTGAPAKPAEAEAEE